MKVIDNFLPKENFNKIANLLMSDSFPYYFVNGVAKKNDNMFYLMHHFYHKNVPTSDWFNFINENLLSKIDFFALIRVKANCYPCSDKKIIHNKHIDYDNNIKSKGIILSLNTCNGGTILDNDKEIKSVANRALFFDPNKEHRSTNCTNKIGRFNININYI
jgi:hypothetical protein